MALGRGDLRILDVGCGIGWLCERLARYGAVTGTDMTQSSLDKARARLQQVEFICGDFFEVALPEGAFDVVTSLEVLSHVADQPAFMTRIASLLKPGGLLILSTQNRPVFERWSAVPAPDPSQIRQWVDHRDLRTLLAPHFQDIEIRSVFPVGDRGLLRFVNSVKLNGILQRVVRRDTVQRWKESAMLGGTLMAFARTSTNATSTAGAP